MKLDSFYSDPPLSAQSSISYLAFEKQKDSLSNLIQSVNMDLDDMRHAKAPDIESTLNRDTEDSVTKSTSTSLHEMENISTVAEHTTGVPHKSNKEALENFSSINDKVQVNQDEYPKGLRLVLITVCLRPVLNGTITFLTAAKRLRFACPSSVWHSTILFSRPLSLASLINSKVLMTSVGMARRTYSRTVHYS